GHGHVYGGLVAVATAEVWMLLLLRRIALQNAQVRHVIAPHARGVFHRLRLGGARFARARAERRREAEEVGADARTFLPLECRIGVIEARAEIERGAVGLAFD